MHDFYKASPKQSPENAHRTLQTSKAVSRELAKTPCVKLHASPRVPQRVAPEMISGFDQAHPSILQTSIRTPQEVCRDFQVICMGSPPPPPSHRNLGSRPEMPRRTSIDHPRIVRIARHVHKFSPGFFANCACLPPKDFPGMSARQAPKTWPRNPKKSVHLLKNSPRNLPRSPWQCP